MGAQRGSSESSHHRGSAAACASAANPFGCGAQKAETSPEAIGYRSGRKLDRSWDDAQRQSWAWASEPKDKKAAVRARVRKARGMGAGRSLQPAP